MKKLWKKLFAITAVSLTISLAGLVMSGQILAQTRCVDNENGTVTDSSTGLMWQKALAGPMDWYPAMSHASNMSLGGHSGWRLPSKDELVGLYNSQCKDMMDVQNKTYWSATTYSYDAPYAWYVSFYNGYVNSSSKFSSSYYARPVRTAP